MIVNGLLIMGGIDLGKTVLFSPVGGTDPISASNMRDGSLLHICRWFKPDEIYLYMSKEMLDFQEQDDRYRYCINKLGDLQEREIIVNEIERPNLIDVQEYDYFYEDFRSLIMQIAQDMSDDDELLVNVSSGTPAMKSGLLVLATLGEFNCKTIQVSTPTRKINEHNHKDYDVEILWDLNEDNSEGVENRCQVVCCPTLSNIKQKAIIKQLIKEYDYHAAYLAAQSLPTDSTENYLELIAIALKRIQLDNHDINALVNKHGMEGFPVKADDKRELFEYALALDIKRKRGEYADYVRAISPLLTNLFRLVLLKQENIKIGDYTKIVRGKEEWDKDALRGTDVEKALLGEYNNFRYGTVESSHIAAVAQGLIKDTGITNICAKLREVEKQVRNLAAHQIVSVTEEGFKKKTGLLPSDVSSLIKELCKYSTLNIKDSYWNAYEDMNEYIINKMEEPTNHQKHE